jgi:hypothetical protein
MMAETPLMMAANGKAKTCADIDRDGPFGVRVCVTERHRGVRPGGPQRRRQRRQRRLERGPFVFDCSVPIHGTASTAHGMG